MYHRYSGKDCFEKRYDSWLPAQGVRPSGRGRAQANPLGASEIKDNEGDWEKDLNPDLKRQSIADGRGMLALPEPTP